jgi:hypothetical protein
MDRRDRSVERSCEDPLCRVNDHVFAIQVIHKRGGPKLPYQAVVIRQSAMHRQGRNAMFTKGGVDPHTSSGPTPDFNCISFCYFGFSFCCLCCCDPQTSKYSWWQSSNCDFATLSFRVFPQHFSHNDCFTTARVVRQLLDGRLGEVFLCRGWTLLD